MRDWFSELLSESPGEPSIRRVVFFLSFLFGAALCFVGVFTDIPTSVLTLATTIVGLSFGLMGVTRIFEDR